MKKMKRLMFIWLWIIPVVILFCSCSEDNLPGRDVSGKEALLSIKSVSVNEEKGTFREFTNGDTIGIFLADYYHGYPVFYAARENYWWYLSEQIVMRKDPIRLLAFYPYRQNKHANLTANEVEIEHFTQTDYMYSCSQNEYVSWENPYANIEMKHVLALIQFKFIKNDYPHDCSIQRVSINNTDGVTHLKSMGTLNLENGEVRIQEGYYDGASIIPENMNFKDLPANEDDYARILVMPMEPIKNYGDVYFDFIIDGWMYIWSVDEGTYWEPGMKYTYEVEMVPLAKSLKSSGCLGDIQVKLTQIKERK